MELQRHDACSEPCPTSIIRRYWAANNILQNAADPRDWLELPADVLSHVLRELGQRDLAHLRLTCRAMHGSVDGHMAALRLR
jgi:hypothetical protein